MKAILSGHFEKYFNLGYFYLWCGETFHRPLIIYFCISTVSFRIFQYFSVHSTDANPTVILQHTCAERFTASRFPSLHRLPYQHYSSPSPATFDNVCHHFYAFYYFLRHASFVVTIIQLDTSHFFVQLFTPSLVLSSMMTRHGLHSYHLRRSWCLVYSTLLTLTSI